MSYAGVFGSRARSPAHEFLFVVAACGPLPRAPRPGPRLRTACVTVASPHPREMQVSTRSGAAGLAKREDSYGRKGALSAGSRARSPGEQAAACDCQITRALGF